LVGIESVQTGHLTTRSASSRIHRSALRAGAPAGPPRVDVSVCTDSLCESLGAADVLRELRESGLDVAISSCGCLGRCGTGVQVCIEDLDAGGFELCDGISKARAALRERGYDTLEIHTPGVPNDASSAR
jgi:hypothetical protein